ncbi:MAG: YceI family protein [Hyphomonas sp.]
MRTLLISASAIALAACGAPTASTPTPEAPAVADATAGPAEPVAEVEYPDAGTYLMDPDHTSVTWTVKHLGLSNYTARFDDIDIQLVLNPEDIALSSLSASIDPKSVDVVYKGNYLEHHADTGFTSWKDDLSQSERWFNANVFPAITFTATNITKTGPDTADVTGDMTLKGVTRPVTLNVKYNGVVNFPNAPDSDRVGFSATTTIKRSDFGFDTMAAFVGDEVHVMIEAEFNEATE